MNKNHHKLIILGSGPAGCTAAIYAARAGLNPVLIRGLEPGGQLTITTDVDNYPGFEETVQGPWLMEQMEKQALSVGTILVNGTVIKCDLSSNPKNEICIDTYCCHSVKMPCYNSRCHEILHPYFSLDFYVDSLLYCLKVCSYL